MSPVATLLTEATIVTIVVAVIGVVASVAVALIKIWRGTQAIHVLVNSNLSRVRLDLRLAITAFFVTTIIFIAAVYKAIARLREPPEPK